MKQFNCLIFISHFFFNSKNRTNKIRNFLYLGIKKNSFFIMQIKRQKKTK